MNATVLINGITQGEPTMKHENKNETITEFIFEEAYVAVTDESKADAIMEIGNDTTPTQICVSVDFELLDIKLSATLECHADGSVELLICPQYRHQTKPLTLVDLLKGINEMFRDLAGDDAPQISCDEVLEQLENYMKGLSLDTLKLEILQVFLHVTKPAKGHTKLEYAFSIKISSAGEAVPKDFTFASLDSVSFGIWNTDNKKILGNMGLLSIAEQLS